MIKALRFHEFGGPEVVRWEDIPRPAIQPGHARVQVKAGALNRLDIWVREELPGIPVTPPFIQGSDASGVITEVGDGVDSLAVGDEVMVLPNYGCGHCQFCDRGQVHICPDHGFYGETEDGNFAEEIVRPGANLYKVPRGVLVEDAAAITLVSVTSWEMLKVKAELQQGEDLLVLGASSGVGSMAIQMGKVLGANVIAITSGKEHCEKALALGADHVIDRSQNNQFAKEVKALTKGKGADVIFEHTGEKTFPQSLRCLAYGGRMVVCGGTTGPMMHIDVRFLFVKQWKIMGSSMGTPDLMPDIISHFESAALQPVIGLKMPMSEGADAQRRLMEENHFGKIVLVNS